MKEYMCSHEEYIRELMEENEVDTADILEYHLRQINWMQHERLVHLLVLCLTAILFLFSCMVLYTLQSPAAGIFWGLLLILNAFYIYHYYFLENTLQKWYKLANKLEKKDSGLGTNTG
ncbi:MAG: hypothetical protein ACOC5A_04885 [Halanaerobiales bacterium]